MDDVDSGATSLRCYLDEDFYGSHVSDTQERIEPVSKFGPIHILPCQLQDGKKPDFVFLTN